MNPKFKIGDTVYLDRKMMIVTEVHQLYQGSQNSVQYLCKLANEEQCSQEPMTFHENELGTGD